MCVTHHHFGLSLLYAICYALLLAGLLVDNITKITIDSTLGLTGGDTYYGGWQRLHKKDESLFNQKDDDDTYKYYCDNNDSDTYCKEEQVGQGWLACCIVGLIVGLVGWWGLLREGSCGWYVDGRLGVFLFGACCIAAIAVWGAKDEIAKQCDKDSSYCSVELAESWYLVLVAGIISLSITIATRFI